jgi:hypothetical protein
VSDSESQRIPTQRPVPPPKPAHLLRDTIQTMAYVADDDCISAGGDGEVKTLPNLRARMAEVVSVRAVSCTIMMSVNVGFSLIDALQVLSNVQRTSGADNAQVTTNSAASDMSPVLPSGIWLEYDIDISLPEFIIADRNQARAGSGWSQTPHERDLAASRAQCVEWSRARLCWSRYRSASS